MMSTINGGHYQTISTSVSAGTPDAYSRSDDAYLALFNIGRDIAPLTPRFR